MATASWSAAGALAGRPGWGSSAGGLVRRAAAWRCGCGGFLVGGRGFGWAARLGGLGGGAGAAGGGLAVGWRWLPGRRPGLWLGGPAGGLGGGAGAAGGGLAVGGGGFLVGGRGFGWAARLGGLGGGAGAAGGGLAVVGWLPGRRPGLWLGGRGWGDSAAASRWVVAASWSAPLGRRAGWAARRGGPRRGWPQPRADLGGRVWGWPRRPRAVGWPLSGWAAVRRCRGPAPLGCPAGRTRRPGWRVRRRARAGW